MEKYGTQNLNTEAMYIIMVHAEWKASPYVSAIIEYA
jgi:hypothetical protein